MTKPSIAILHYTSPPTVGGVELLMGLHAGLFAEHGYPTRVISGMGEPFRPDVGVEVIPELYSKDPELLAINEELESGVVGDSFHGLVDRISEALVASLVGVKLCIVHNAFTLHFNLPLTAALHRLVESAGSPRFVSWCHDLSWKNDLYIPKMRDAFPWRLLKEPLESVDYVVVSATRQEELSSLFGVPTERLRVIPAGVDPAVQLRLQPETVGLVRRLKLLEGDLLMLAPVRITKRKNLELSIRIVHALRQQGVRAKLVVTGPPGPHNVRSGDYVGELRRLRAKLGLENEVVLLFEQGGPGVEVYQVSNKMMYDFYGLSDLMLFTSAQEGFGIPLLEAGLFKLSVFCSHIPPFREIGLEMVNYFELEEKPAAVADRIRRWMEEDQVYQLRRRVLGRYSWESIFRDQIEPLAAGL